jgi:large subunit ribosomal protein L4
MQLELLNEQGQATSKVDAPDTVFARDYNEALVHQIVVAYQANARQGTRAQLDRTMVKHSTKKPWRQKGTGRARQGSIRAPQWRGGGVAHGPKPRDYSQRTPKKMIAAALLGAISDRARGDRLIVIDSLGKGDVPSTKAAAELLASVKGKHVLVVLERGDEVSAKSVRNLSSVHVIWFDQLNAYDVLVSDDIVFTKSAFDGFVASKSKKEATA